MSREGQETDDVEILHLPVDRTLPACYSNHKILTLSLCGCVKGANMVFLPQKNAVVHFRCRTDLSGTVFLFWRK